MSTEHSKIGEGVVQQRIPGLELLDQLFLSISSCSQRFDCGTLFGVRAGCFAQSIERIFVRFHHAYQPIITSR